MVNIFQITVERLSELGFYDFLLPFILLTTVLFAVLRKTQLLGESPIIQGIISVSVGLFIFGMPVIVGINITQGLTAFLTQGAVIILVLVIGFLVASFFYPNLMEKLGDIIKPPGPLNWIVWAIAGLAIAVGLFGILGGSTQNLFGRINISGDFLTLTIVLIIVLIIIFIVTQMAGKEVK